MENRVSWKPRINAGIKDNAFRKSNTEKRLPRPGLGLKARR